jgi:hypothetical protein
MLQMLPSLRVLRTMPRRLTTITSCLVFWPLVLTSSFGLAAFLIHHEIYGGNIDWAAFSNSLVAGAMILLSIPLVLRYGFKFATLIPIMVLISVSQGFNLFIRDIFKIDVLTVWPLLAAGVAAIVAGVWCLTYLALCSAHPWRGNLMKLPGMQRSR